MLKTHEMHMHAPSKIAAMLLSLVLALCVATGTGFAETMLEQLKSAVATAQTDLTNAQNAFEIAQSEYESAESAVATFEQEIEAAQADADEKKGISDSKEEAAVAAESAQAEAQQALDANAADIAAAQTALEQAQSEKAAATTAVEQAQQQVDAAQGELDDAEAVRDQAQAVIDAWKSDPGTNEGHKEWTAYGFFQYVRDNAPANSAAYWDAQCAMDILDGGVNTTGHSYATNQGPAPDGQNASQWTNIASNIVWDQRGDAVGLDNFRTSLQLIEEFNSVRAEENAAEGTNLRTDIKTNCRQMAISIVQCDTSKIRATSHTQAYKGLENLSWSSALCEPFSRDEYTDPYAGWYDEEKVNYQTNNGGVTGHYKTIVDLNSGYACVIAGAAICNYEASYGECREISTFGYFPEYGEAPTIEQQYSTTELGTLLDEYYEAQVQAGMFGTPEEEKTENRAALEAAEADVAAAQAKLETAETNLANKQAAEESAAAQVASKQANLQEQQGKTAGLQAAIDQATATATAARTEANNALAAYEAASAHVTELQNSNDYIQAKADRDAKQPARDAAAEAVESAEKTLSAVQAELAAYTNLATNKNVAITNIKSATYNGKPQTQNPTVMFDGKALTKGADYTLSYKNNVNAGTATLTVTGTGDYSGSVNKTFTISKAKNPMTVKAIAKSVKLNKVKKKAQVVKGAVVVSKVQGKVTYTKVTKGSSKKLTVNKKTGKITVKKGTKKGTYKIKVKVATAGNANYSKASKTVTVTIKVN